MKRRWICVLAAILLMLALCMTVSIGASAQETSDESAELSDELLQEIGEADKEELISLINGLSGEGVEKVKEVLLVGLANVERDDATVWGNIASFCEKHIDAVSLAVCAVAICIYTVVKVRSVRGLRGDIRVSTNNAVEAVEIARRMNAEGVDIMERASQSIDGFRAELGGAVEEIRRMLEAERQKSAECDSLRSALKHNADADILVADTVNELLQLANIPQCKKDAIYSKVKAAKALIASEVTDGEAKK